MILPEALRAEVKTGGPQGAQARARSGDEEEETMGGAWEKGPGRDGQREME